MRLQASKNPFLELTLKLLGLGFYWPKAQYLQASLANILCSTIFFHLLVSVWLLYRDKGNNTKKEEDRDKDKIVFSNDIQDKEIVSISYLVMVDKT